MQRLLHAFGDAHRVSRILEVVEEHSELVATKAREHVPRAHTCLKPSRDTREQAVAGQVPETVVDLLEAVEIEKEQRDGLVGAPLDASDGTLERFEEVRAIDETGEGVVHGSAPQFFFSALPCTD